MTVDIIQTINEVSIHNDGKTLNVSLQMGQQGPAGQGVPTGGTTGQVLRKASNDDFDTEWGSSSGGAGSSSWGDIGGTLSNQTDLQTALDGKQPAATVLTNTTASFTTAQETKLAGIAAGATVNSPDATLLNRAIRAC